MNIDLIRKPVEEPEVPNRCVVRLKTSAYVGSKGDFTLKKTLTVLQRKSSGHNILEHDCDTVGVEDVLPKILNLNDVQDGIYLVQITNVSRDWESGWVDDYDYQLIPYKETKDE